jgi:hypothetical protein
MRQVNTFSIGSASGSIGKLQKPAPFPAYMKCTRIRVETVIPVKNTSGSSKTLTNAEAVGIMQNTFGSFSLSFGDRAPDKVDIARIFDRMREMALVATGRDMLFNNKELRSYANTDADAVVIAAGATVNVTVEFIRPFIFERFAGGKIQEWCPGADQMRQIDLEILRGSSFPTNLQQDGNATATVIYDTAIGDQNNWVPVYRLFTNEQSGMDQSGPAFGGGLLGLWERTAVGASTSLTIVTLYREGDTAIHEQVSAARLSRDSQLLVPQGSYDPNALVTMVFQLEEQADLEDVPTASGWLFRQHNNNLSPMQTVWLYVPTVTSVYVDQVIAPNVLSKGGEVKLVSAPALAGKDVPGHIAAISGVSILTPGSTKYSLVPGRRIADGRPPETILPDEYTAAVKQQTANLSPEKAAAKLAQESKSVGKFIPGARSVMRGGYTGETRAIANHLAPSQEVAGRMETMLGRMVA